MARIFPFHAVRYNTSMVNLSDVVTQPYDKISPAMQQAYYQRSPYNLVRIILGLPELFDKEGGETVYTRAARDLKAWRHQGVLVQEQQPVLFAYSQTFTIPGTSETAVRRGFIALGELTEYDQGIVFRHERTLSKPKADRLALLEATRAHFGQIFMLYSDPVATAEKLLFDDDSADGEVTDEYGVLHRVRRVSDPATINMVVAAMADKKLIIADGHHRYETALGYSRRFAESDVAARDSHALSGLAFPEAAVMMTFVNMDSSGLVILPTHRVVFGLKDFTPTAFLESASSLFTVSQLSSKNARELTNKLASLKGTTFVAYTREGVWLLEAKPEAIDEALSELAERQRRLDVTVLHSVVLEGLLGLTPESIRDQANLRYVREASEGMEQVDAGAADVVFLMNPATLNQLREIAFAGDVMPQKSTDFFPKLLSGLAIYALD